MSWHHEQASGASGSHLSRQLPPIREIVNRNDGPRQQQDQSGHSIWSGTMPRSYSGINIDGQAHAIFGDVNLTTSNLAFTNHATPQDQKTFILRSLYFEQMNSRKAQIDARASSPEYVDWVWKTSFMLWLESLHPFYWITGKPGSGKSTLMTHISSSSKTKEALQRNGKRWKVVKFFFDFRAGSSLANSIEGLLRSLLHQVVLQIPEVADYIDHDQLGGTSTTWTLEKCLRNLTEAAEASSYHICAFIDGLDEFDGSHGRLVELIHTIKSQISGIKLCLACRPYIAFEEKFRSFESLVMQDHNHESIDLYTAAKWSDYRLDHQAQLPQEFCKRIRQKANGVFLWARLATDELLIDFLANKPVRELYAQLDAMPEEVEEMYLRSLERMSEPHQQEAAAILYVILQADNELPIDKLYAALATMRSLGHIGREILPIDCDADNARRVFAVVGDLTDQISIQSLIPRLVYENTIVKCRHDPVECVVLTHETLRSFLIRSSWLRSRISMRLDIGATNTFWLSIYLTEISSKMLSGPRDMTREVQFREAATQYTMYIRQIHMKRQAYNAKELVEFENTTKVSCETRVLDILNSWPRWTSLLLFAVQEILERFSTYPKKYSGMSDRILPLSKSVLFSLHTVICTFYGYEEAGFRDGDKIIKYLSLARRPRFCLINVMLNQVDTRSATYVAPIDPVVSSLYVHSADQILLRFLDQEVRETIEWQQIFDSLWARRVKTTRLHDDKILHWLFGKGCRLTGRNLCAISQPEDLELGALDVTDLIVTYLSANDLSHHPRCKDYGIYQDVASHFRSWEGHFDIYFLIHVVGALSHRGASIGMYANKGSENSVVAPLLRARSRGSSMPQRSSDFVQNMLDAGADPYFVGNSGDAFTAIAEIRKEVENTSRFPKQQCQYWMDGLEQIHEIFENYKKGGTAADTSD